MTVGKLIHILEEYDEDQEVHLMVQPSWPLVHEVAGVVDKASIGSDDADEDEDDEPEYKRALDDEQYARILAHERNRNNPVYILACEGHPDGNPYGDKNAWECKRT